MAFGQLAAEFGDGFRAWQGAVLHSVILC
jgi:hypothetical protein